MNHQIFNYKAFFNPECYGIPYTAMSEVIIMIKNFKRFERKLRESGNTMYQVTGTFWNPVYHSYVYHIQNCTVPTITVTMTDKAFYHLQCIEDTCSHVWIEGENFEKEWWNNYEEDSDSSSESNDSIEVVWSTPTISHGYNQLSQASTTHVEGNYGLNGGDMSENWDDSISSLEEFEYYQHN